ncbi:hypothetical protein ALQ18_02250 [Pseudomonas marginalis pv. marginalis]|nr:hypothetical protein ALQ18_02250 [Pseudomonas marginalis pv. marginalis]
MVIESWITCSSYPSFPQRKFVGLTSEMEEVVAKYRAAGNDWNVLNKELNLGAKTLEGEGIYIVKVKPDDPRFSYEVPNGKENGACPNEWVPGGATKSGTTEAGLIGSESVTHNSDISTLLKNFHHWEKLQ